LFLNTACYKFNINYLQKQLSLTEQRPATYSDQIQSNYW